MRRHSLRHIPLLDDSECVAGLAAATDFLLQSEASDQPGLSAVLMVGGEGKRLLPLTQDLPKPMLPVGDKPLLERTIARLREAGIRRVLLATHYKPQAFAEHFANGESFGVEIDYVQEEQPLGTAGALASLATKERLLVMNGDVFTDVNYRALLDFHEDSKADLTVGVRNYEFKLPYGVVQMEAEAVTSIEEKPMQRLFVNAGVYLLEPSVCQLVPKGKRFDMTELINALLASGRPVAAFPISEYWIDIGHIQDYRKVQRDLKRNGQGAGK